MEEIVNQFEISKADAEELLGQMIIFANGISAYVINDANSFSKETVSFSLSQVCIGIVLTDKLRDGSIDLDTAKELAHFYYFETMPKKKSI